VPFLAGDFGESAKAIATFRGRPLTFLGCSDKNSLFKSGVPNLFKFFIFLKGIRGVLLKNKKFHGALNFLIKKNIKLPEDPVFGTKYYLGLKKNVL
jgi:hypothetical protein